MKILKIIILLNMFNNLLPYHPIEKIKHQLSLGEFVKCTDNCCYLSDINFNQIFCKKYILSGFIGANLSGAIIKNSILKNIDFSYADLSNINFTGSMLININLYKANLSNTIFKDATLVKINLNEAESTENINLYRTTILNEEEYYQQPEQQNFEEFNAQLELSQKNQSLIDLANRDFQDMQEPNGGYEAKIDSEYKSLFELASSESDKED